MVIQRNQDILMQLFDKYNLTNAEKEELLKIINYIFIHDEFQHRMTDEYYHHDKITLGEHILEDTIVTYLLSKKHKENPKYNTNVALKIAMMHDLYMYPWKNNPNNKQEYFCNKHGFRHPIEAILNAISWFPEDFSNSEEARKIIDGVLHHMYPLPVRKFVASSIEEMELKNPEIIEILNESTKKILTASGNRGVIGPYSMSPSQYKEGRIMSLSDKIVSISNLKGSNIYAYLALVTGKNKNIDQHTHTKKR